MSPRTVLFGSCILYFLLPSLSFFNLTKDTKRTDLSFPKSKTEIFQPTLMEICDNGIDDDGDGLVDCFDDDCFGTVECEDFYYGPGAVNPCTFVPEVGEFDLELLYQTDGNTYPIDQRVGAFVGDMDGDGIPEIVSHNTNPGKVYIFNGEDGTLQQEIDAPASSVFHQMAIADVDSDGNGDIFYIENGRSLIRYEAGSTVPVWQTAAAQVRASFVGVHVADFDGDGTPEVYVGSRIFNSADGTRLAIGTGNYGRYASSDSYTLAYDIFAPGDPKPGGGIFGAEAAGLELLAGNQVYTVELGNGTPDNGTLTVVSQLNVSALEGDGFVSIGDIDDDGKVDLLIMDGGRVYVWDPRTETQIGDTYQISGTNGGGRINVGDFDNDGKAEFGTAGRDIYVVLEYDPATNTLVELWTKTGVDDGSQRTGSSLFDFEGDGNNEVVYSEEANLFILDGATGAELIRIPSEAGTRTEYPLVADVNGDGAAEIIVTAQVGNGPGFSGGDDYISVYRSKGFPWVSARPVWNQHGYFNTNINDDLTVPATQQDILNPAFENTFNSFLAQTTIIAGGDPAFAAPDATIEILGSTLDECPKVETEMKIKNLGSAILPAVTPIAFYDSDPTSVAATLLDVSTVGVNIAAGDSATITYNVCLPPPIFTPLNIYVVVNDSGFVAANLPYDFEDDFPVTSIPECDFTNNIAKYSSLTCVEICGDGKDNDGDGLADEPNITAPDTTGCSGDVLAQMTVDVTGGTWSIISSIGSTISPTGVVTLGTNHSSTPDFDTVIYALAPCPDTILVSTVDEEDPSVTCPANQSVNVNANCETTLSNYVGSASATDNCSTTSNIDITQSPTSGTTIGLGTTTVTLTAEDEAGNESTCTFTVTTTDDIDPSITCPANQDVTLDGNCEYDIADFTNATVSDNCSLSANIDVTQSPTAGTTLSDHNTSQVITLTAEDEAGNTKQCTFTITLKDQTDPTITCPANQNLAVGNNCFATVTDYTDDATIDDNCSADADITVTQNPTVGTILATIGSTHTITLTAEDEAGNSAQCTFTITLTDETDPTIFCPTNTTINVDGDCEYDIADFTGAVATDNCSAAADIDITQAPTAGTTISGHGTTQTVTLTAEDEAGNTKDCTFDITLNDNTDPAITCPANQTLIANANCEATIGDYTSATVSDNCTATGSITVTQSPVNGTTITGTTTVTLTANDGNGNTADCTFNILIDDDTNPSITCPANSDVTVNGDCEYVVPDLTGGATVDDNCTVATSISITQNPAVGSTLSGHNTTQTITLTANDGNGNTAQCTFDITLKDESDPSILCPSNQDVFVDGDCEFDIPDYTSASVDDNCTADASITVTQAPIAGTTLSAHNTTQTITLTANDGNGNTAQCNFDITLKDNTQPSITCPGTQTLVPNADCEITLPDYTSATVDDNCTAAGSITVTQSPAIGTMLAPSGGSATVTLTADDGNGNTVDCSFSIDFGDISPPSITCPADTIRDLNADCQYTIEDFTDKAIVADNCAATADIDVTQSPIAGIVLTGAGTVQSITLTANDGNGNTTDCSFNVALRDTTSPAITCPLNADLMVDNNCEVVIADYTSSATSTDNCSTPSNIIITQNPLAGTTLSGNGTTQTITLTATDESGNTKDCEFEITVLDETDPSIICPLDQTVDLDANCEYILGDFTGMATLDDNCTPAGVITVTQSPTSLTVFENEPSVETITITADDNNGGIVTCTFELTIQDVTDPIITCPTELDKNLNGDCEYTLEDLSRLVVGANECSDDNDLTITQIPAAGTLFDNIPISQVITLTAEDNSGNSTLCQIEINLIDEIPPTVICPANKVETGSGCELEVVDYLSEVTITDNCSILGNMTITQSPAPGTILATGVHTITITVEDESGNEADCAFVLELQLDPPTMPEIGGN